MANSKAPFKRGQMLYLTCSRGHVTKVKYVKWWGIMRSSLIVVRHADGRTTTEHVNYVKPV